MALYSGGTEVINGGALLVGGIPTGTVVPWTNSTVATGFLECDGSAVSRSTYSALFAVIGTTYGSGNGSSTFNLPDLQDEVVVGKSGSKALASTGGANTTPVTASGNVTTNTNTNINVTGNVGGSTGNASLSTPQLASHSHGFPELGNQPQGGGARYIISRNYSPPSNYNTNNTGSGGSHSHNMSANFSGSGNASSSSSSSFSGSAVNPSILQPYLTLIYIIKT